MGFGGIRFEYEQFRTLRYLITILAVISLFLQASVTTVPHIWPLCLLASCSPIHSTFLLLFLCFSRQVSQQYHIFVHCVFSPVALQFTLHSPSNNLRHRQFYLCTYQMALGQYTYWRSLIMILEESVVSL